MLPEAFTTGSSIMPQKRNPDVFELIRGAQCHRAGLPAPRRSSMCAKLPSGYQRDLQLLKFPLFRGIDIATATLDIVAAALDALDFRPAGDPPRSGDPRGAEEANRLVVQRGHSVSRGLPAHRRANSGASRAHRRCAAA